MRSLFAALPAAFLLALTVGPAPAGTTTPTPTTPAGKAHHHHHHARDPFALPKQVQLTADQQAKVDALKKQYAPKLAELHARIAAVFTPERHKAAAAARQHATAEGKKGKELQAAVRAALNLTPDEQAKLKDAFTARKALVKEIRHQEFALLTDAQKAQLKHHHHKAGK